MPWCPECDRFLSPSTVTPDGRCPRCGRAVDPGRARAGADALPAPGVAARVPPAPPAAAREDVDAAAPPRDDPDADLPPVPWHLKLLVGAVALYLGWRAIQGVEWVLRQI